ncbi:uncharacterized protein F4822DRAFT_442015 [Hypoxylon trugodes]|uniref:uncharacterized protein n=1 Tax=Hypoxylon trugodes TaxID=326681 RepID=UPI002194E04C|nr:uncharacterized protein F4822DRAFT_442015 [Hypoxylon trugodes]KAI1390753.1 hypothetical protein F4822DRAFT_442015 [Hypoxylon trugodes]
MRSSLLLPLTIAAFCCWSVAAEWFRWSDPRGTPPAWLVQKTSHGTENTQVGWSPKPTPAAGRDVSEEERALEMLKRGITSVTTHWTNSETCGWVRGAASEPFTCSGSGTCATNSEHIVACVTDTLSPFYSTCLNYAAWQSSLCVEDGSETGCCLNSQYGECATYFWTGEPVRSMYRCVTSATVVTMLDEPQFVIDASRSSTSTASQTSGNGPGATLKPGTPYPGSHQNPPESPPDRHIGVIVGSTIGGVVGLLVIGSLYLVYRTHRKATKKDHQNVRDRLDTVFRYAGDPDPAPTWQAARLNSHEPSSTGATAASSRAASRYVPVPASPSQSRTRSRARPQSSAVDSRHSATRDNGEGTSYLSIPSQRTPRAHSFPHAQSYSTQPDALSISQSGDLLRTQVPTDESLTPRRNIGPPSYTWYLMSPIATRSQLDVSSTARSSDYFPSRVNSSSSLPESPRRQTQNPETPPPRYSYMNPYPDATPEDLYNTPRTAAGPYRQAEEEEVDDSADYDTTYEPTEGPSDLK